MAELRRTCLYDLHAAAGAKFVPFADYEMPVQYPLGVLQEHLFTRRAAGLFDVGHMGQVQLRPKRGGVEDVARALETLVPADILGLKPGRQRYGLFTNDGGGIEDDLMIAHKGDHLLLVVNAARKAHDLAHLSAAIGDRCHVEERADRALLALQGPAAEAVLTDHAPGAAALRFMDVADLASGFGTLWIARSGYTGEDGFEISVAAGQAPALAEALLADERVRPIGLGARDSLRLEAGLCLYGADLDLSTSPAEADLGWAVQKVRRSGGARAGGFPGADRILRELDRGPARRRVGLLPEGRAPMRPGTEIFAAPEGGGAIGWVTSGAYGPSVERPISMAYVTTPHDRADAPLYGAVRGKRLPARVAPLPFRPPAYKR